MKPVLDPKELILQLQSKGWMTDAEWRKFGKRQAGVCVDENVMSALVSMGFLYSFCNVITLQYMRQSVIVLSY